MLRIYKPDIKFLKNFKLRINKKLIKLSKNYPNVVVDGNYNISTNAVILYTQYSLM